MKFIKLTDICNPKQWKTISTADFVQQIDKSKYFGGVNYGIC